MNDTIENGATPGPDKQPAAVKMLVLAQYIRDLSFENFLMRKGVTGDVTPDIQIQVALDAKKRAVEHQYEVISKFTVRSNTKENNAPLFLIELEYGAIFHIENVPDDQLHPYLLIECPRMIFPFIRRIVSDVTRDGGFPPLNMDMVDFVALYRQEIARRTAAQAPATAPN